MLHACVNWHSSNCFSSIIQVIKHNLIQIKPFCQVEFKKTASVFKRVNWCCQARKSERWNSNLLSSVCIVHILRNVESHADSHHAKSWKSWRLIFKHGVFLSCSSKKNMGMSQFSKLLGFYLDINLIKTNYIILVIILVTESHYISGRKCISYHLGSSWDSSTNRKQGAKSQGPGTSSGSPTWV